MRFTIVDRAARRVTAEVALRRSDFGVGPVSGWWSPFQIDGTVLVTVDVIVPRAVGPQSTNPIPTPGR